MDRSSWTPDLVGRRLVEAFKPGMPILSAGRRYTVEGAEVAALGWLERFIAEPRDRRLVAAWASCGATGTPFAERLRGYGWPAKTSRRRTKAALAMIAAGLNGQGSTDGDAPWSS